MLTIEELTAADCPAWDAYVRSQADGLPQHLSAWRTVLYNTYGYRTHYLLARRHEPPTDGQAGTIAGVLPLFFVRSLLTGHTAMTMPGGLCADSREIGELLLAQAREVARRYHADRLVLQDSHRQWPGAWQTTQGHVNWVVDLRSGEEGLWQRLHRNIRRQVRIGRKEELRVEIGRTPALLPDFYSVLSRFTHQAGTPVFGLRFLEEVVARFPNGYNIVVIYLGPQPIGGYFQLEMGQTVYGAWGATLHDYLALRPVYLAYWSIMADAIAQGFTCLDMGRSPLGSTASAFKGEWSGVAQPIYQQVTGIRKPTQGDTIVTQAQTDHTFRTFRRLWPKLPFPVAQFLGPKVRRHIPFA